MEACITSIMELGLSIGHWFDASGHHMADLGIDLGIERNGKLWIIEVTPFPFPFGPHQGSILDKGIWIFSCFTGTESRLISDLI